MTLRNPLIALLLTAAAATAQAQDPAAADTFEREMVKVLKASHAAKRSVIVHIDGQTIAGLVKAIGPDVLILGNREQATILVKREQIDALEAN